MRRSSRQVAWQLAVIAAILANAPAPALGHPEHTPTTYRWVQPPPGEGGEAASLDQVRTHLELTPQGSLPRSVSTADHQFFALFPQNAFPPTSPVEVSIRPSAADELAAAPPGTVFDSNAYELAATTPDGPANPQKAVRLSLRYARTGQELVTLDDSVWRVVTSTGSHATAERTAEVDALGIYAVLTDSKSLAAAVSPRGDARPWRSRVAATILGVGVAVLTVLAADRWRQRRETLN